MRKVTISLALVALLTVAVHADNIALDAIATASSEYDPSLNAAKINDGTVEATPWYTTVWASRVGVASPHWVQLAWASSVTFNEVKVYGVGHVSGSEDYDPYNFQIQISGDGQAWTTIDNVVANTLNAYTFSSPSMINSQYLRVYITTPTDGKDDIGRLAEVEVLVPEPATMLLLSLGGIGMCVRRRK